MTDPRLPVRARKLLRVPKLWAIPLVLGTVVVAVMTALYIGAAVDPLAHLRGLPVGVVNLDAGVTAGSRSIDLGKQVEAGLLGSPAISSRLHLEVSTLAQAEQAMSRDDLYATLVIPPNFTASLLQVAGLHVPAAGTAAAPHAEILTNERAGTVGASLASGILQPALAEASRRIGQHLAAMVPASALTGATRVVLANPVTVIATQYRPLPDNSALGLSAFYLALLTMLSGFIGATMVNSAVDSALGYATSEVGPRWHQRAPVPISRWQTLLIKWPVTAVLTAVMTGVILIVAVAGLGLDAPYPGILWLYMWLCAASIGIGVIVLLAIAGGYGQLLALLLFVYAGLASAGGTVPLQALPGFPRLLSYFEPLRQVLAGTRSILYFGAAGAAGLTQGTVFAAVGLVFWLALGSAVVRWYDRKHFYRIDPDVIAYVTKSVQERRARQAAGGEPAGGERSG